MDELDDDLQKLLLKVNEKKRKKEADVVVV